MRMGQRIVDGRIGAAAPTAVASVDKAMVPAGHELYRNDPNLFNDQTLISYRIPQRLSVQLELFDELGQRLASLVDQVQEAGTHQLTFNAAGLTSGVYCYRLRTGGFEKDRENVALTVAGRSRHRPGNTFTFALPALPKRAPPHPHRLKGSPGRR